MTENAKQDPNEKPERESANGAATPDSINGDEKIEAASEPPKNVEKKSIRIAEQVGRKVGKGFFVKDSTGEDSAKEQLKASEAQEVRKDEKGESADRDDGGDPERESQDSELEALKSERDRLRDQYLRALAESENIRKIADREKREAGKFGATRFARDMLSVHDNLIRALDAADAEQRESSKALIEGIELTLRELLNAFSRQGIAAIEPVEGDEFDPNRHQAMFYAPIKGTRNGTIVNVLAKGFTLHERLLRAAQVGVSSFNQSEDPAEEEESSAA